MKTAIVTTLRNANVTLQYFVGYHLSIGFDHLFLFFDDPNDPGFAWYKDHPAITAVRHDTALRKKWLQTQAAVENYAFADKEVMARQLMNADLAMQMALSKGINWLLHIDSDELFYSPGQSVMNHFSELSMQGVEVACYLNQEAIPESSSIQNYFTEVSLFKRNRATFTPPQLNWFRNHFDGLGPYFNFYDNGKAAGAVTHFTHPMGVHLFEATKEPMLVLEGPVILHFPCCGFDHFLAKYQTLGWFSDRWFNRGETIDRVAPVHSWSRDVVQAGNETYTRAFYEEVFVRRFEYLKEACLHEGIFTRVRLPTMHQLMHK